MSQRTKPLSRATDAAVPTTGTAFAVPTLSNVTLVRIDLSADGYVGVGSVASPIPTAADTNTTYHKSGVLDYYFDGVRQKDGAYIYVYSVATTLVAKLSYYI